MLAPSSFDDFLQSITLHADEDVRVIDKPCGLVVQKGTRTEGDLDSLLIERATRTSERLRLVHRLDRETAGCLALAASREAARHLGRELMGRRVGKLYWAVVHGVPEPRTGIIALPLIKARGPDGDRVRPARAEEASDAWPAITRYEVLEARLGSHALLALEPETGRQHQLRAHLWAIGHPIAGDKKYRRQDGGGDPVPAGSPSLLHLLARRLTFRHPRGHWITCEARVPPHMRATFERFGFSERSAPLP